MKKLIIFLLCVAVLGGGGFFGYKRYMKQKEEKIVVDVVPVSMMYESASYFNYSMSSLFGTVADTNAQKLYIDSKKLVAKVCVEEGQEVKKGDTLLEYDMTVVELELAEKENNIKVIEEQIKKANRDLENIKKYKPAENAPKQPEINWDDYFPDVPDEPEMPETPPEEPSAPEPVMTADEVIPSTAPADGNGSAETPFIINVKPSARVSIDFIKKMAAERKWAEICVYSDKSVYMYKWIIDPDKAPAEDAGDWNANTGINIDDTGAVTLDTSASMPAKLSFARPKSLKFGASPDELVPDRTTTDAEDIVMPEPQQEFVMPDIPVYEEPKRDPNNHDYEFTKKEIENKIIQKQDEIKKLELNLKKANRELETYKKRKKEGKEVAEIDGTVRKIGKPSDEEGEETEKTEEELYAAPDPDENAFAVIEGEGGVEVVFAISENDLEKYAVGNTVSVKSFSEQPVTGTGKVRKIDEMPLSYYSTDYGSDPNASTYLAHIKLDDPDAFNVNDNVSISVSGEENSIGEESDSIYIPIHYVRSEGGDHYIMRQNSDGVLEKRYVLTGAVISWNNMIEIKGGISLNDKICFPYGKDVKEGVKTRETDVVLYPDGTGGIG